MDSEVMLRNSWLQLKFAILYNFPSLYLDFFFLRAGPGLLVTAVSTSKYEKISFSRSCAALASCWMSPGSPCQHIHTVLDFQASWCWGRIAIICIKNLLRSLQSSDSHCAVRSSRVLLAARSFGPDGTDRVENEIKEWNKMIHDIFECIQQQNHERIFCEKMNTVSLLEYEKCCQINSHLRVDVYLVLKIPYWFGGKSKT